MTSKIADIAKRLRPLGNRVLVHKAALENVSAGGEFALSVQFSSRFFEDTFFSHRFLNTCRNYPFGGTPL